jgi:hypothetical protein
MVRSSCTLALLAWFCGCGVDPHPRPSGLTGTWVGPVQDPLGRFQQNGRLEIIQIGNQISGTYQPMPLVSGSQTWGIRGNVFGTIGLDGTVLDFILVTTAPGCTGSLPGSGGVWSPDGEVTLQWSGTAVCGGVPRGFEEWIGTFGRQ